MGMLVQDCIKTWWFVDTEPGRVLNSIKRMQRRCDGTCDLENAVRYDVV